MCLSLLTGCKRRTKTFFEDNDLAKFGISGLVVPNNATNFYTTYTKNDAKCYMKANNDYDVEGFFNSALVNLESNDNIHYYGYMVLGSHTRDKYISHSDNIVDYSDQTISPTDSVVQRKSYAMYYTTEELVNNEFSVTYVLTVNSYTPHDHTIPDGYNLSIEINKVLLGRYYIYNEDD